MSDQIVQSLKIQSMKFLSQVEKETWTSERIRQIESTFAKSQLDKIGISFPSNSQRFLYTLFCAFKLVDEPKGWNALIELALEEKIRQVNNIWLEVRICSNFNTHTATLMNLLSDPAYNYTHFFSIINQPEFKKRVSEIAVVVREKETTHVTESQRKRGYHDKGSLRPKHLSPIWLKSDTLDIVREKYQDEQILKSDLSNLYRGFVD